MKRIFTIAVLLGVAAVVLPAQDNAGMQEAIRFERAKDAADARQARIETRRMSAIPSPGASDKNREQPTRKKRQPSIPARRPPAQQMRPTPSGDLSHEGLRSIAAMPRTSYPEQRF